MFSRTGRLVKEVLPGVSLGAGENLVRWDGSDETGAPVPGGLYFLSVEAGTSSQTASLAVVR